METALKLLMRDGAVRVAFHPKLTTTQYAELLERVAKASTKDELRHEMFEASQRWQAELVFDTEIG